MAASNSPAEKLITENIDVWTSAIKKRGSQGRGSSKKIELYGIKKLRELILELAYSGLLCVQGSSNEDFGELLNKMQLEKERYHQKKGVRLQKFKLITENKMEVNYPSSWKAFYFDDVISYITDFQANGSFSSLKKNVTYYTNKNHALLVRLTDLRHGLTDNSGFKYTDEEGYKYLSKSSIEGGELVVANVGAGVGTTLIIPEISMPATLAPNMFMVVLSKFINKEYFLQYSQSPQYKKYISKVNSGTGQPKINKTEYKNCIIPIPSFEEQGRIVAKVNELMALCDQLEQQTESSLTAHQTLVETLLNTLLNADQNSFDPAWERIAQHFDVLFTTEHSIDQLKQTILQLAVMGKLVPQDPNDEPASVLLEKIAAEKEQLIKDKVIKKQKPLPPISEDEKPFELPKGWEWSRLSDVLDVRDGTHDSPKDASGENTYPLVTSKNFCNGEINFSEARQISEKDHLEISKRSLVEVGDILFSMIGGNLGNQVIVKDPRAFSIKNVALLKYYLKSATQPEYIKVFTEELAIELQNKASGGAQPFVSLGALRKLVFALPPFDEQHRIVAKVDGLMSLCDNLKLKISESQTTQLHLADAMAEQALNS
jgi:type I restriction enzyme S subunit